MTTLLSKESALMVQPTLALCLGLNEAMILQHVHHFLSSRFHQPHTVFHGHHWIHNTYKQWQALMPFLSLSTMRRAIGNLEKRGVLISFDNGTFQRKKYYRIDYDRLTHLQKEGAINTPSREKRLDQKKK